MSTKVNKVELLDAILANAITLKDGAKAFLSLGIGQDEKIDFTRIACFLIFSSIEECGKYMLVRDIQENEIEAAKLADIKFRDHNAKMNRFFREGDDASGIESLGIDVDNLKRLMREAFREGSLYVDVKNGVIKKPGANIAGETLEGLCKLCGLSIVHCQVLNGDIAEF